MNPKKSANQYTRFLTPGQMTKLGRDEVRHYYNVFLGRAPDETEYKVYENHPDNTQLLKDLKTLKQTQKEKGQGGPFAQAGQQMGQSLVNGVTQVMSGFPQQTSRQPRTSPSSTFSNVVGAVRGHPVVQDQNRNIPASIKNLGTVTTQYGGNTRYEPFHPAIDVANQEGTPIPEFKGGVVTNVGQSAGYGNFVEVRDPAGNTERYSHLQRAFVKPGQQVQAGQPIGAMGRTGNVYSTHGGDPSHLDYMIVDAYNRLINPLSYLSQ